MAAAPHSLYNLVATFIPNCPDFLRDNIGWNARNCPFSVRRTEHHCYLLTKTQVIQSNALSLFL
uniref:Uncharacterized protein n=1 Tax=Magallana gigas TaxID=29159 RepID=K1QUG0_MAGGI